MPRTRKRPAARKPSDVGQAESQKLADAEAASGFAGDEVDSTPNEHYTVSGVTAGKPTPETERKPGQPVNVKEPTDA